MRLNISVFFIVFLSCLMTNCSTENDFSEELSINGTWILKNEAGGRLDYSLDYDDGDFVWNFTENPDILTLDNELTKGGFRDYYDHLESGTYDYEIQEENSDQILFINNKKVGYISIMNGTLIIDERSSNNNFILTFEQTN